MDRVIRRWLAGTPLLLTAYLAWRNRTPRRRCLEPLVVLAVFVAWVASSSLYLRADRVAAVSILAWLHRHALFCAAIAAIVAAMRVSRRRTRARSEAPRAWTAALPMGRSAALWQTIAVDCWPAVVLACILAVAFGGMSLAALLQAGTPAPVFTWGATTGGVVLGAALSYRLRPARQEEAYEDSRYVPHRRRAGTPVPVGSLAALGTWPVRQMFATAKPKTLAQVMVPLLLAVPLGSQAADVMVIVGLLTAVGAVVTLVAAVASVSASASRWLRPLPLQPGRLARNTLGPAMAWIAVAAALAAWLAWVLGWTVASAAVDGIVTLAAGVGLAAAGCLAALYAGSRGSRG
jgi:hypothetical protein